MAYPDWVEKFRQKGTNISCIRGKYYLYACSSVYDPKKKRAKKITGEYLGRITEDGLIPPRKKQLVQADDAISIKEFGASETLSQLGDDIYAALKKHFPHDADTLFTIAILRILEKCPFKRIAEAYKSSFLSEKFKGLPLSSASIADFLKKIGHDRQKIVAYLKEFIADTDHILFDGTNIVSNSANLGINRVGYNSHSLYEAQINLLLAFSSNKHMPSYYKVVPGNIRDVVAFKQAVLECGISNMTVIADKGFGSEANFALLEQNALNYIVPLRRNNGMIDKTRLSTGNKRYFDGHFLYRERVIWYYSYQINGRTVVVYLDQDLRNAEEKDYALRLDKKLEGYTEEGLLEKQYDFGSLAICSNIKSTPEEIYSLYKTRAEIEQSFDFLKNLLDQDKTYLQSQHAVEAWGLINHLSLMLVYKIYNTLRQHNLTKKYSVEDFISHLKYIRKAKINNVWHTGEITKGTQTLLHKLDLNIT